MAEIMKLNDGTEISLVGGAFIDDLSTIVESEEEAIDICSKFTKRNLSTVKFYHVGDEEAYKTYEHLILVDQPSRQNEIDEDEIFTGRVIVKISLRLQTDLEKRISDLEIAQTNVELALTEVYESIGG